MSMAFGSFAVSPPFGSSPFGSDAYERVGKEYCWYRLKLKGTINEYEKAGPSGSTIAYFVLSDLEAEQQCNCTELKCREDGHGHTVSITPTWPHRTQGTFKVCVAGSIKPCLESGRNCLGSKKESLGLKTIRLQDHANTGGSCSQHGGIGSVGCENRLLGDVADMFLTPADCPPQSLK